MNRLMLDVIFAVVLFILAVAGPAYPQSERGNTTFTGTAQIYGTGTNIRTDTRSFTLTIRGVTSRADAQRYLSVLQDQGQMALLNAMANNDLGRFSLGGRIGEPLNAVVVDNVDGKKRVRAVFRRWIGYGEFRGGYRSVDYPFGYLELTVDPRTGRGDGTFFPAARIRFKEARNGRPDTVEIEDFGTFPGKLMGVRMRGVQLP